jgi:hypothetical protein
MSRHLLEFAERFWSKVDRRSEQECWPWLAYKDRLGRGMINAGRRPEYSSRVAYMLTKGSIPDGLVVMHSCDDPGCNNPAHLWLGTRQDNMSDAVLKGRMHYGEANGIAKLTWKEVQTIREEYAQGDTSLRKLARKYKVSYSAIRLVVREETW